MEVDREEAAVRLLEAEELRGVVGHLRVGHQVGAAASLLAAAASMARVVEVEAVEEPREEVMACVLLGAKEACEA